MLLLIVSIVLVPIVVFLKCTFLWSSKVTHNESAQRRRRTTQILEIPIAFSYTPSTEVLVKDALQERGTSGEMKGGYVKPLTALNVRKSSPLTFHSLTTLIAKIILYINHNGHQTIKKTWKALEKSSRLSDFKRYR